MKVVKILVKAFASGSPTNIEQVTVPEGSMFLDVSILHDGIYAWYRVPELVTETITERFYFSIPDKDIPDDAKFIRVLDTVIETKEGQGIVAFPIFKLK